MAECAGDGPVKCFHTASVYRSLSCAEKQGILVIKSEHLRASNPSSAPSELFERRQKHNAVKAKNKGKLILSFREHISWRVHPKRDMQRTAHSKQALTSKTINVHTDKPKTKVLNIMVASGFKGLRHQKRYHYMCTSSNTLCSATCSPRRCI